MFKDLELRRFNSFISDFCICFMIGYLFLSQEQSIRFLTSFEENIIYFPLYKTHIVLTLVIFVLYKIYFGFIFVLTPSQFISGLCIVGQGFFQRRLSAVVRVFLAPLLAVLAPFDYLLRKKRIRTLSYLLTGTDLETRGGNITAITSLLFLFLVLPLSLYSPLLYKNTILFNPKVTFTKKVESPLKKSRDFSYFKTYGSKSFKMSTFTDLQQGRFVVDPSFEIKKVKGKVVYRPMMTIWDHSYGIKGLFRIRNRFDTLKLLKNVRKNYLFFDFYYPVLANEIKTNAGKGSLSKKAQDELFNLLSNTLYCNPFNLHKLFIKGRFNIFPYTYLKRELFSLLGYREGMTIDFVKRGNEIFIRSLLKNDFNSEYNESFFSLSQLQPITYEIIWQKNKFDQKINEEFTKSFFFKSKWGQVVEDESNTWASEGIYNPLSIIDVITNHYGKDFEKDRFQKYITNYFDKKLNSKFLESVTYRKILAGSVQRVLVVLKIQAKNGKKYYQETIRYLTSVLRELKNKIPKE